MRAIRLLAAMLIAGAACAASNPLPNPGFEYGSANWAIADEGSQVIAAAAHSGTLGLRAGAAEYTPTGAAVTSASLPVTPRQEITLRFWARANTAIGGVFLFFYRTDGKAIPNPPMGLVNQADGQWHEYTPRAKAPAGAASVARTDRATWARTSVQYPVPQAISSTSLSRNRSWQRALAAARSGSATASS